MFGEEPIGGAQERGGKAECGGEVRRGNVAEGTSGLVKIGGKGLRPGGVVPRQARGRNVGRHCG